MRKRTFLQLRKAYDYTMMLGVSVLLWGIILFPVAYLFTLILENIPAE